MNIERYIIIMLVLAIGAAGLGFTAVAGLLAYFGVAQAGLYCLGLIHDAENGLGAEFAPKPA